MKVETFCKVDKQQQESKKIIFKSLILKLSISNNKQSF
ncbi:uncharacterized protein METZ01_LOCUS488474 [marine metagenome]|uniref:Uncharacterized protein n=1 Tax=marine metagenome TaxID=408172 RepID=A0A383CUA9_9ZZZZ